METIQKLNAQTYKQMLESLPVALFFTDGEAEIRVWNKAIAEKTGISAADVIGRTLEQAGLTTEICGQKDKSSKGCVLKEYLQNINSQDADYEGRTFCVHFVDTAEDSGFTCQLVYADSGSLLGVVGIANDFAKRGHLCQCSHSVSSELDSNLEGNMCSILNAAAFYDALNRDWHRYQRYQNIFSILSLEIDYYSHFENVLGTNAASNLITKVIENTGSTLRRSDIIGQVGANRFIILLANSDRKSALKVANMLLDNLHQQTCSDLPFVMSASIGAVSVEDKQSLDKTLERADNALQRSVDMGRNQVTFWG